MVIWPKKRVFAVLSENHCFFRKNYLKKKYSTHSLEYKKYLAQGVRQKRDISERRRVEGGKAPFNPYLTRPTVTVRPARGRLTPKMNIAFFIRNLILNFFIQQFFRKKLYFQSKLQKTVLGAYLTIF